MKLPKILTDKRGLTGAGIALVVTLVSLAVALIVGLVVTGQLYTTATSMDLGTSGNATRTTLFNNIYSAFNLSVIAPIIAGAGLVIGMIFTYFAWRSK